MKKILIDFPAYTFALFFYLIQNAIGFASVSILISKYSLSFGNRVRYFFYRMSLNNVGDNVLFSYGVIFTHSDISIGNNVRFGPYNTIGLVDFEDDIIVGQFVDFLSGSHQHGTDTGGNLPFWKQNGVLKRVHINRNVWIGAKCIIMNDISENTVVGSGSIVTKKFDRNYVLAGNPAKEIHKI